MGAEEINRLLDYPTKPLPRELMLKLPGMKKGQRIIAIRKARGINRQIELRKKAQLASATCATMETRDAIPIPKHLYNISRVLGIDPLLIIFGLPWEDVYEKLTDGQKMFFLRLRRGWTQKDFALELEKVGLIFKTNQSGLERATIAQWERGAATPMLEKRNIIRKVLGDKRLFQKIALPISKSGVKKIVPALPDKPKLKLRVERDPIVQSTAKPELTLQEQIDAKAYEALAILGGLEKNSISENTNPDSLPSVLRIKIIIRELRQIKAEEEAQVIEADLVEKLIALKEKIATNHQLVPQAELKSRALIKDRKRANRSIGELLRQFPGKSIVQVLPILVKYEDWVAVRVAVERIEKHQAEKIRPDDWIYLQRVKSQIPTPEE